MSDTTNHDLPLDSDNKHGAQPADAPMKYENIDYSKQPNGLYRLFFAEMWERFSFYGMRALLVLYMVRQLLYDDTKAYGIYAAYGALVYATPIIGGALADRVLGYRNSIMLGGILMTIGHFVMAIEQDLFFFGALSLIIIGNGFFKPNVSSLVGRLYVDEQDPRRDRGFTIFYMGINLGAFLAPLLCGTIGETLGWHYGFGLAGVGMLLGLITFWQGSKIFEGKGDVPDQAAYKKFAWPIYIGSFLVVPLIGLLVSQNTILEIAFPVLGLIVLGLLLYYAFKEEPWQRDRIFVILILVVFSTLFWAFFELAGSALTLFTDSNVNRNVFGAIIPTSTFQSVNPMFIIIMAPVFSMIWKFLGKKGLEPYTPVKFALGLIQLGLGFGMLVLGAMNASAGEVAVGFLILGYFLHTTGELSLSPIGLSMVTKLSPAKIVAFVMGAWFLSNTFAHHIAGFVASMTSSPSEKVTTIKYIPNDAPKGTLKAFQGEDRFMLVMKEQLEDKDREAYETKVQVVVKQGEGEALENVADYKQYASTVPGEDLEVDLVSKAIDPENAFSSYSLIEKPELGSLEFDPGKAKALYHPLKDSTYTTVFKYQICDKRDADVCDEVTYQILVSDKKVHPPVAYDDEITLYTKKEANWLGIEKWVPPVVNKLQIGYDPDGTPFTLEVVGSDKPKAGFLPIKEENDARLSKPRSLILYAEVFELVMYISVGAGLFLLLISPLVRRWMHGIH